MNCYRRSDLLAVLLSFAAIATCAPADADDQPGFVSADTAAAVPAVVEPSAYQELVERLQSAERRLAELENAKDHPPLAAQNPPGVSRLVQADAAFAQRHRQPDNDSAGDYLNLGEHLAKRLQALESDFSKLQAETPQESEATFEIGGRMQLDFQTIPQTTDGIGYFEHPDPGAANYGDDPEDRIGFRRLWLEMQGEFPDLMLWRFQVDFTNPNEPQYRDVYLGWRLPYHHSLLVGNQKRPIGLDALNTSQLLLFTERPLSNDAFNDGQRRLGAMMYAYSDDLRFNWRYGIFNLENTAATGQYLGDSLQLGGYGRLAATPWYDETSGGRGYLHVGVSGSIARPDGDVGFGDSNANEARFRTRPEARTMSRWLDTGAIAGATTFEQVGLESALNVGSLQFQAEYLATTVQRDNTTAGTGPNVLFHGGYVQAAYFLTGEFVPWDREAGVIARPKPHENFFLIDRCTGGCGHGWGAWQVVARYDYLDLTDHDIFGGIESNETVGLNWYWNAHAKLQFNLIHGDIHSHRAVNGFTGGNFLVAGTRLAIDF